MTTQPDKRLPLGRATSVAEVRIVRATTLHSENQTNQAVWRRRVDQRTQREENALKYATASIINLAILCLGIAIGLLVAPRADKMVLASQSPPQAATPSGPPPIEVGKTVVVNGQNVTGVQPTISAGDAVFYRILTHHLQADELVVNGFDLLKLQQGELNLLQRFVPPGEVNSMIQQSRATDIYTVGAPHPAKPAQVPQKQ